MSHTGWARKIFLQINEYIYSWQKMKKKNQFLMNSLLPLAAQLFKAKMRLEAQNWEDCVVQWLRTQTWIWVPYFPMPAPVLIAFPWAI